MYKKKVLYSINRNCVFHWKRKMKKWAVSEWYKEKLESIRVIVVGYYCYDLNGRKKNFRE